MCIRDSSEALSYLRQKGLSTVEDLEAFLESSGKSAADYRNQMKPKEARSKVIDGILASQTACKECKPCLLYTSFMAQHAILRFEKHKGNPARPLEAHHERQKEQYASNPDIDACLLYTSRCV